MGIIDQIATEIDDADKIKSSHWKHYLNGADYTSPGAFFGAGQFNKRKSMKAFLELPLRRLVFGSKIMRAKYYAVCKSICCQMSRQLDVDVIRHVFVLDLLDRLSLLKGTICVIGDGKANFVAPLLHQLNNDLKLISVNLPEILINDHCILTNHGLLDDQDVVFVKDERDLDDQSKKLYLLTPSMSDFLTNKNIDLFVNISSMQEMTPDMVEHYFKIIKSCRSYFYCCNREYKKLCGGEELIFDQYPWSECRKYFYEDCPFHQKFYSLRPPFVHRYDGNIKHALVKYA